LLNKYKKSSENSINNNTSTNTNTDVLSQCPINRRKDEFGNPILEKSKRHPSMLERLNKYEKFSENSINNNTSTNTNTDVLSQCPVNSISNKVTTEPELLKCDRIVDEFGNVVLNNPAESKRIEELAKYYREFYEFYENSINNDTLSRCPVNRRKDEFGNPILEKSKRHPSLLEMFNKYKKFSENLINTDASTDDDDMDLISYKRKLRAQRKYYEDMMANLRNMESNKFGKCGKR
jgi:hypothetical protein